MDDHDTLIKNFEKEVGNIVGKPKSMNMTKPSLSPPIKIGLGLGVLVLLVIFLYTRVIVLVSVIVIVGIILFIFRKRLFN